MSVPVLIKGQSFQQAWQQAATHLRIHSWSDSNLVVHASNVQAHDPVLHEAVNSFASACGLQSPNTVANWIFPASVYDACASAQELFDRYVRIYEKCKARLYPGWGTYFHRMISYPASAGRVNQLGNIIGAINGRDKLHKAAYTIVIQKPGGETKRTMGAPCLNYIAVQISPGTSPSLGLLAVYRNHDFLEKAYGNYWGLCRLVRFLAQETGLTPGSLTCVSSRAYIDRHKRLLATFLDNNA